MTQDEARAYLNYLLTLSLRREEAFGPLALTFLREHDLDRLGILPEEQFSLLIATVQAFAAEPKRYSLKLELLHKARQLLPATRFFDPQLAQQLDHDIKKTAADLAIYNEAMKGAARTPSLDKQVLIVETDVPEYFLDIAQKRAAAYYQAKYRLSKEAKTAQHFGGPPKRFDPENTALHKEFPGACAPFMNARTNAFHMMLPFDLKISRKPDDPLEAGVRIFYAKMGYSYPLRYEMGKLCSYHDGQVYDIPLDDPHLLFVSVSGVKDPEFQTLIQPRSTSAELPSEFAYPMAVLEHTGSLGTFIQISCNFKIWFDASVISILIQGAPDLYEYGLQGGAGLMTRSYASDKVGTYAEAQAQPWQEGLSFNFVNMHLQLSPGVDTAFVPHSTPIFTVYPVLNRQCYKFETRPS
ncbi:MAG: hypothetical protein D6704_13805 [Nitrospirae bacterium]|nr:MAG: hypothetical protein D6704_13805 [Nitrospirota bacterium]